MNGWGEERRECLVPAAMDTSVWFRDTGVLLWAGKLCDWGLCF